MQLKLLFLMIALAAPLRPSSPSIGGRFSLTDAQSGKKVTEASYQGRYRLVFFGFTHCPVTCPTGLAFMGRVLSKLGSDVKEIVPLFITLDPGRDDATVVRSYLKNFDPRLVGLVGSQESIARARKEFRLESESYETGGKDGYLIEHPAIIYLMGRNGRFLKTLPISGDAAELARGLRSILRD